MELRHKLERELEHWPALRQQMAARELEAFVSRLMVWGNEHQCQLLLDYAMTLHQQIEDFDWDQLPLTVEQFPVIWETLNHVIQEAEQ